MREIVRHKKGCIDVISSHDEIDVNAALPAGIMTK